MQFDRRWMWTRMAVWLVVIAWCGFVLVRPDIGDEVGRASLEMMGLAPTPPAMWAPLVRPPDAPPAAQPVDDAESAALLGGALGGDCPIGGLQVHLTLGPGGLVSAEALGPTPPCAAGAVWGAPWPRMPAPMSVELTVSTP